MGKNKDAGMIDLTHTVTMYRECLRNIWNLFLINYIPTEDKWTYVDCFDNIIVQLFSMFLTQYKSDGYLLESDFLASRSNPIMNIHIVPAFEYGVPISINRNIPPSGYWDYPKNIIEPKEVDLRYIGLFDFDLLGFRNFEFYLVRIVNSTTDKLVINRNALIRVKHAKVFLDTSG